MWHQLQRHWSIFAVHVIDVLQFRLRALVWFLVGVVNTLILMLFWWATLQASSGDQSFTLPYITSYYILLLSLATVGICHIEESIAYYDIYKGDLYGYLLRPYPYLAIKFQQEIVWRFLAGFWAVLTILLLNALGFSFAILDQPALWALATLSIALGSLTSFFLKSCLGLLSIWLTNIRGVMDLYTITEIIFAGFVIPLSLFPDRLQTLAQLSPLATFVYYPVLILTTPLSQPEIMNMLVVQIMWLAVFAISAQYILRKGIRHYTGVSQ